MSNLPLAAITPEQAEKRDFSNMKITLKLDGTLINFENGKLISPRCERSNRFKHILDILNNNNMPNCFGEMFIPNGNVFDISSKENWDKAHFSIIDLKDEKLNFEQRQILLKQLVNEISSPFIEPLKEFNDFKSGWKFVEENKAEGLVIRNEREWIKIKSLQNTKIEIVSHEIGKNRNRVSGTSKELVRTFNEIKNRGNKAIAEISYPFITETGHFFQPRLTNLIEEVNEKRYSL